MKLQKVSQTITPFAGISFIHEEFNKSGLSDLIDNRQEHDRLSIRKALQNMV